ncbi:MAG TPA: beta-ketoacyl-[acyl-carrier-protein] synthase family protein [Chitinophagales bacterium]|nr:beta-ketoacyl-[acyl-carrier-protein] synthase family protein [Chitinophagales bacterium]
MSKIVVTGLGIISPIGNSVAENHTALKEGRNGLSQLELFPTRYATLLPFGEIKITNEEFKKQLGVTESGVTRTTLLALHAFQQAIADSGLSDEQLRSEDTALANGNTIGGMCLSDGLYMDANKNEVGSEYISSYNLGSVNMYIQQRYGINGVVNTFNTACSSSANAIAYGARLIRNGFARRAIVGGTDSLAKFTINGFNSLNILSGAPCKPFDAGRSGLNLGEGAAFLVLEREEDAQGKKIYAEVSGWANTNDAYHPSSLSDNGDGPYLAMKEALELAKLNPEQIGFINAHGTATENNDEKEGIAMKRLFETVPAFASTKSNIGHTLGAAGAIEAVYCILNLLHQEVYQSLRFENAIETTGLTPVTAYQKKELQHVMSNSFGFGGNCSSLIFSKV